MNPSQVRCSTEQQTLQRVVSLLESQIELNGTSYFGSPAGTSFNQSVGVSITRRCDGFECLLFCLGKGRQKGTLAANGSLLKLDDGVNPSEFTTAVARHVLGAQRK